MADWWSPSYALTQDDIQYLIPGITVTLYPDLDGKTLDDLLDRSGRGMVLFVEHEDNDSIDGHWLALARQREGLLMFDPYGGHAEPWFLDRTFVSDRTLKTLDEDAPKLDIIVKRANIKPIYSPTRYQRMVKGVDTCGRHCVVRLWNHEKNDSEYKMYLQSYGEDYDKTVTDLTNARLKNKYGTG